MSTIIWHRRSNVFYRKKQTQEHANLLQLVVEESQWKKMAEAVARVMWLAAEES